MQNKIRDYLKPIWMLAAVLIISCGGEKQKSLSVNLLPIEEGSALQFRGYVTDDAYELVGKIHTFVRRFSHVDTIEGMPVYAFYSDDEKSYFYQEDDGTLNELKTINLTDRLILHGLRTSKPVLIRYWEPVLKSDQGVGTEWQVLVDTTVAAQNAAGEEVTVRYYYSAKGRYEGWSPTAIPESQSIQSVLDVNWYDIENFIVNESSNDSLFVKRGTAHYYFDPNIGMVKYITDYQLRNEDGSYVSRHGTWELIEKKLTTQAASF